MVKKYKFPSLFINQFYPRPGTPAARLKKINTIEARRRTAAMTEVFKSYSTYTEDKIGSTCRVLVCEMATDKKQYVGHNKSYEHLLISSDKDLMGKWVNVRITEVSKFYMKAEIVNGEKKKKERVMKEVTVPFKLIVMPVVICFLLYLLSGWL